MNWKEEAKSNLRRYYGQKSALDNLRERHMALREQFGALKSACSDKSPVQGGGSQMEDSLINNIVERDRLSLNYRATGRLVKLTERGLYALTDRQRRILELFYMARQEGYIDRLCEEMHLERSRVYILQDEALYQFTISMYGITDY